MAASSLSSAPAGTQKGLTRVAAPAGGGGHSLAIKVDGTLWAWGYNAQGQLGIGRAGASVLKPARVNGLTGVTSAAGGDAHTLALKKNGTVWAFGENDKGQLGKPGSQELDPVKVPGLSGVTAVDADGGHSYAVRKDGTVRAWGENEGGDLGTGSKGNINHPVAVSAIRGIVAIAAGRGHTLALTGRGAGSSTQGSARGAVYAWGSNRFGQLGTGKSCDPNSESNCAGKTPVAVKGLPGQATAIAAGQLGDYSVALLANGTVSAWGRNDQGQVGSGSITSKGCKCRPSPVQVRGLTGVKAIAASGGAAAALKSDGTVWVWGDNAFGQLGNGKTKGNSPTPVQVKGVTGIKAIAAGGAYLFALKSDRTLVGWGINSFGQLGIGNTSHSPNPVPVGITQASSGGGFSLPFSATALLAILLGGAVLAVAFLIARSRRTAPAHPAPAQPAPWSPRPPADAQEETAFARPVGAPQGLRQPAPPEPRDSPSAWRFQLTVVEGEADGTETPITGEVVAGREQEADIVIKDDDVSRRHARFRLADDGLTVEDLSSTNGTFVNGRRLTTSHTLRDGDKIRLGQTILALSATRDVTKLRSAGTLVVIDGKDAGREIPIVGATVVGRVTSADVVIEDEEISARHVCFQPINGSIMVEDLGSSNGTFVNGQRLGDPRPLKSGDRVQLGGTVLEVRAGLGATEMRGDTPETKIRSGQGQSGEHQTD